jgi:hypothetical protein
MISGRGEERVDASIKDGADADARLDNALSDKSSGQTIFLESANYSKDRTIDSVNKVDIKGTGISSQHSDIDAGASWTYEVIRGVISDFHLSSDSSLTVSGAVVHVDNVSGGGSITVDADRVILTRLDAISVTFASGTSNGVVDASTNTTVTDNGSNTVGDIS